MARGEYSRWWLAPVEPIHGVAYTRLWNVELLDFIWNSEVGRRTLGVQTFWFQKICQNHIVWDAGEVVEFTRKHTANVRDGLGEIRRIIETLVAKRDARRDGFVECIREALREQIGADADEVAKRLVQEGIPRGPIKEAMEIARSHGGFTIFAVVDALTESCRGFARLAFPGASL